MWDTPNHTIDTLELPKQLRCEFGQISAPYRPGMLPFGLDVFVTDAFLVEQGIKFIVALEKEILLSATDPKQLKVLINSLGVI